MPRFARWLCLGCVLASGRVNALPDGYFDPDFPGLGRFAFNGDIANPLNSSQVLSIAVEANGNLFLAGPAVGSKTYWWLGELSASGQFVPAFGTGDGSGRITSCQLGLSCAANDPLLGSGLGPAGGQYLVVSDAVRMATGGGSTISGTAFGNPITVNDANGFVIMRRSATQADGKILVAGTGYYTLSYPTARFGLVRFTGNLGSKDHSFNAMTDPQGVTFDGGFTFGATANDSYATATEVLVRPDGRIVLVGFGLNNDGIHSSIYLMQLNSDGSLDSTFGDGGSGVKVVNTFSARATDARAVLDSGGDIAIAWRENPDQGMNVILAAPDGHVLWTTNHNSATGCALGRAAAVAVDSAGRVLVGGSCQTASETYFLVIRFRGSTGERDFSFGNNSVGLGFFDDTSFVDEGTALVFDRSGRLFVGGISHPGDVVETAGISRLTYDLIYTNDFESAPRGCLPPDCN